jgi:methionine-gamma-lyase
VIVHSGPLYAATETIINKILGQFGVQYVDFPAGATREELDEVMARAKAKGRVSLIYLESPANPTNALVDVEAVARRPRRRVRRRRAAADRDRQHLPRAAVGQAAGAGRRHQRLQPDQICRRAQRPRRRRRWSASKALLDKVRMMRNTMGGICDPNTAWMLLRSLETLELRMTAPARMRQGLRIPARPSQGRDGRLSRLPRAGSRQADIYNAIAPAPARPSRSI